jgi:hypothetical protein
MAAIMLDDEDADQKAAVQRRRCQGSQGLTDSAIQASTHSARKGPGSRPAPTGCAGSRVRGSGQGWSASRGRRVGWGEGRASGPLQRHCRGCGGLVGLEGHHAPGDCSGLPEVRRNRPARSTHLMRQRGDLSRQYGGTLDFLQASGGLQSGLIARPISNPHAHPRRSLLPDPRCRPGSLQQQIRAMVTQGILAGRFRPGQRMPSSRGLAEHLGVSRITVTLAYADLVSSDYLTSQGRSGYFVSDTAPLGARVSRRPAARRGGGFPGIDRGALLAGAAGGAARGLGPLSLSVHLWSGRPDAVRPPELAAMRPAGPGQARFCGADQRLLRTRRSPAGAGALAHHPAPPGDCGTGGRGPADLGRAECAVDRGDRCFWGQANGRWWKIPAIRPGAPLSRRPGPRLVPVDVDMLGLPVGRPWRGGCRFHHPSHQCPTNATMPVERRTALLDAARAGGVRDRRG